jgi:hypothetical protein
MPPPKKKKPKKKDCDCSGQEGDAFSPAQAREASMMPEEMPVGPVLDPEQDDRAMRLLFEPPPPWHPPWQFYPNTPGRPIPNWYGPPPGSPEAQPRSPKGQTPAERDLERIKQGLPLEEPPTWEQLTSYKEMY